MTTITSVVVDENDNHEGEEIYFDSSILPDLEDDRFVCLWFIDRNGRTVFNYLQVPVVSSELQLLSASLGSPSEREVLARLESLCVSALRERHHYLKFMGD